MSSEKSQLEQGKEDLALLTTIIKDLKSELSLAGTDESDPEYIRIKTAILFQAEKRNALRTMINYRIRTKKENTRAYRSVDSDREVIIERFKEEKAVFDAEIAEMRENLRLEKGKTATSKRKATIASLEEKLVVSVAKKKNISRKIRYHNAKLKR